MGVRVLLLSCPGSGALGVRLCASLARPAALPGELLGSPGTARHGPEGAESHRWTWHPSQRLNLEQVAA